MVKVSIIVPVYNVEKYLRRCLDSLVNQTMKDIEIILVNDASPDNCTAIMEEYRRRYPGLVRCIYLKENLRQGGARNRGLGIAEGKYVSFVDSDDWADLDYIGKLYKKAEETGSDIVYADFMVVKDQKKEIRPNIFPQLCGKQDTRKRKMNLLMTGTGPCACIIRKSLLEYNGLYFPEKMVYEDMAVCPLYSYYAGSLGYVGGTYYYYYQRESSVTHDTDAKYQKEEAKALLFLLNELNSRGIAKKYPQEAEAMFTKYFYAWGMYGIYNGKFSSLPEEYMEYLAGEMQKRFPKYRENPYIYGNIEPGLIQHMYDNDRRWLCGGTVPERKTVTYVDYYTQENVAGRTRDLFNALHGRKIALWGAGKKGREFLKATEGQYDICCVIDNNPGLEGQMLDSRWEITVPEKGLQQAEYILVINKNYYGSIKEKIKEINSRARIINMDVYLLSGFTLDVCIE